MSSTRLRLPTSHTIRQSLGVVIMILATATLAYADTLRITVDRATIWNRPSAASVVVIEASRGATFEIIRRLDEWYEVVVPGNERRTGFVRVAQIELVPATTGSGGRGTTGAGQPPVSTGPGTSGAGQRPPSTPPGAQGRATPRVPERRTFVNVGAGYRFGSEAFTRTTSAFTAEYAEEGSITADYGNGSGVEFDVMGGFRFARQIGAAVGVTYYPRSQAVAIDASVPHPLYFNEHRDTSFDDSSITGRELAIHASLVWIHNANAKSRIMIFGGPSFFTLKQNVVTDLVLSETYPFDEVTVTRAITEERSGTVVGFHIGGDFSHFFSPSIGVGVSGRFSRASLEFDNDSPDEMGGVAGAAQIGGGLRFRF